LNTLGFEVRIRGSHHLFRHAKLGEIINLQRDGSHTKPYQVKQIRNIILRNKSGGDPDEI
jgi:predicted RNA binding protein YcfA (HicA-like mRNA interferase family)